MAVEKSKATKKTGKPAKAPDKQLRIELVRSVIGRPRKHREVVKGLRSLGYDRSHQKGSHIILRQNKKPYHRLTVPDHPVIARGTLAAIAREIGMSTSALVKYLN